MRNIEIQRMCYEILGIDAVDMAERMQISLDMFIKEYVEKQKWRPLWPDSISTIPYEKLDVLEVPAMNGQDIDRELDIDAFIDENRKRLQVFNLVKAKYLAERYATIESNILDVIQDAVDDLNPDSPTFAKDIDTLVNAFAKLRKTSDEAVRSISLGIDDNGLPTVIVKDLTGASL